MYSDEQMRQAAERFLSLKHRKSDLNARLLASERELRAGLAERGARLRQFGEFVVSVKGPRLDVTPVDRMAEKGYKKDGAPF